MSDNSSIEWTDATWTPIVGTHGKWACTKVSPGCANCYAERLNVRFGGPRYAAGYDTLKLDEAALTQPIRWGRPRNIFVCSMTDLFEERVPDHWIDRIFAVMGTASWHNYQVLTKRAVRMRDYMVGMAPLGLLKGMPAPIQDRWDAARRPLWLWAKQYRPKLVDMIGVLMADPRWPFRNVWMGVSAENQKWADERIPLLGETPAAHRWVSAEPLLGPIDLHRGGFTLLEPIQSPSGTKWPGLNLVIVGGESGNGARHMNVAWAADIIAQCRAAKVPVFVKQLGRYPYAQSSPTSVEFLGLNHRKGGEPMEWPEALRVRELPW